MYSSKRFGNHNRGNQINHQCTTIAGQNGINFASNTASPGPGSSWIILQHANAGPK